LPRREGAFLVEDVFDLGGGLNTADSPFMVRPNEATGGFNYDLLVPGAVRKRGGHLSLNATANSQTKSHGFGLWDKPGSTRVPVRAGGKKLQNFSPTAFTFTNLFEDTGKTSLGTCTISIASPGVITFTAHGLVATDPVVFTTSGTLPTGIVAGTTYYVKTVLTTDTFTITATPNGTVIDTSGSQSGTHTLFKFTTEFLNASSLQPHIFNMFNTASTGVLWGAGAGASKVYGAYSSTQVTANGVPAPTASSFTATPAAGGSLVDGTYRYTLVYRKASTQALSNALAATEASGTTSGGNLTLNLAWTLTNNDTTKYDKIYIYRSSISGVVGFTTGDLIAIVSSGDTTYVDGGTALVSPAENVPRANSLILDNSELPTATYTSLVTMKRRMVTASDSTVRFSDVNKPESWPTAQTIVIPSGGSITSLGIIGLTSSISTEIDEALVVFKQSECWVITGDGTLDDNSLPNWSLKFVSNAGTQGQASTLSAEGYLFWVNYRGIFMWNGSGKPTRLSRKIWDKFQDTGDIDKSKLGSCFGFYSQKRNEVQWYFSSNTYGEQLLSLRLDLAHTIGASPSGVGETKDVDGVFVSDLLSTPFYGGMAFLATADSTNETIYLGNNTGFVYGGFSGTGDGTSTGAISWEYITPNLHFGAPNIAKRYHKVIAWVLDNGPYTLTLSYWTNYKFLTADANSISLLVNDTPTAQTGDGIWDVGLWDVATWDAIPGKVKPITFNLSCENNGCEGDSIKFKFSELSSTQTPILYGFSVYYTDGPMRKS